MEVQNKSIVSYIGSWIPGVGNNAQVSATAVSSELSSMGFTVLSSTNNEGFFSIGQEQITFQMKVRIDSGFSYGDVSDVQSIIDHAVYVATGTLPISSSITAVQAPNTIAPVETGQPGQQLPPADQPKQGWFDKFISSFETFGVGTILGIGLAIAGVILVVSWAESKRLIPRVGV